MNSSAAIIGTETDDGVAWYKIAKNNNWAYFYNQDYNTINSLYPDEVKSANSWFINSVLCNNMTIYCSHDPLKTLNLYGNSAYAKELLIINDYYSSLGFNVSYSNVTYNGMNLWKIILTQNF